MESVMKFIVDKSLIDVAILAMGLFSMALIFERYNALFLRYSMKSDEFMGKILKSIEEDRVGEALNLATANSSKPLAYVVKRVLERADRDDRAIDQSLDIAASEIAPKLSKNLSYLAMCSNVVTLIGLLGTVMGLIMSFKAVSFADPAQKQTLLADGISMAMHSTAMGLLVAIPVMVIYSFLHARQTRLFSEIDANSNKLLESLKSRDFSNFGLQAAYPANLGIDAGKKAAKSV